MPGSTFRTNPIDLVELLEDCHRGKLQLPDFQRSWVWDEDRIKSLIASISRSFPVGALMALDTGGEVNFKPRLVEGAPIEAKSVIPSALSNVKFWRTSSLTECLSFHWIALHQRKQYAWCSRR